MTGRFITERELQSISGKSGKNDNAVNIASLFEQQLETWPLLEKNTLELKKVLRKEFSFNNFTFTVQFNPKRILSTGAKVDKTSVSNRPCFLCSENLPGEQLGLIADNYVILFNPYPVFKEHLTIPLKKHEPQLIFNRMGDMLKLSEYIGKNNLLFYNGPECGASAPDHFHFQSCGLNDLPITDYIRRNISESIILKNNKGISVRFFNKAPVPYVCVESGSVNMIEEEFKRIYTSLHHIDKTRQEPLMNVISFYSPGNYRVIIIARSQHRPSYFFEEGKDKILTSPAAVDLGGVFILPRKEDYLKINESLIRDICRQVTPAAEELYELLIC